MASKHKYVFITIFIKNVLVLRCLEHFEVLDAKAEYLQLFENYSMFNSS